MPVNKTKKKEDLSRDEYIRELVKTRLSVIPRDVNISVGADGMFSRDELLEHIETGDEIGQKMIQIDMEFLRSFKNGEFYKYGDIDNAS